MGIPVLGAEQQTIDEPVTLGPKASARAAEVYNSVANRPDEIPDDNSRQNLASLERNWDSHEAAEPAGDAGVPDSIREVISSSGHSLDASIQRAVEDRMGDSFRDVRIHTGPKAASACEDIDARAFTVGNHIAFGSGEYDPESPEGQHLLAHELAHVRQQTGGANGVRAAGGASGRNAVTTREPGGALSMMPQEGVELEIDPDPQLEREAEETAQRVMEGGELGIQRLAKTEVHVQRHPRWSNLPARDDLDEPLEALKSLDVSEELLAELQEKVAPNKYQQFVTDIWRIGDSIKDLGGDAGDVGEVLSTHPDKTLVESFVEDFEEQDELVVLPGPDNTVKGFEIGLKENPEFDKLIVDTESGKVVKVIEEKPVPPLGTMRVQRSNRLPLISK